MNKRSIVAALAAATLLPALAPQAGAETTSYVFRGTARWNPTQVSLPENSDAPRVALTWGHLPQGVPGQHWEHDMKSFLDAANVDLEELEWSLEAAEGHQSVPSGFTISKDGVVSGTVPSPGQWTFDVVVRHPDIGEARRHYVLEAAEPSFETASVSAGGYHTCAVTPAGSAYCWGNQQNGRLGWSYLPGNGPQPAPVQVRAWTDGKHLSGVKSVSAGRDHSCTVLADGRALCWGSKASGKLGYYGSANGLEDQNTAREVLEGGRVVSIEAGPLNTCLILDTGALKCWGYGTANGAGPGTWNEIKYKPDTPVFASGTTSVGVGSNHACASRSDGSVWCWGSPVGGRLGNGMTEGSYVTTPVEVIGLGGEAVSVKVGEGHACALLRTGHLRCWGVGHDGRLGDSAVPSDRANPVTVTGLDGAVKSYALGASHTCAVTVSGKAWCWGDGAFGKLGNSVHGESGRSLPTPVFGLDSGVKSVTAGWHHTCAVMDSGGVKCWGMGSHGQLGIGSTPSAMTAPANVNMP